MNAALRAPRVVGLLALLTLAAAGQWLLERHVRAAAPAAPPRLAARLDELPTQLGPWIGRDLPLDAQLDFADEAVYRVYRHERTGQQITVWIAHSATGADRAHHPGICMAVLGKQENAAMRTALAVPGDAEPVLQMNFGAAGERTWTFYWHYALAAAGAPQQDFVQRLYHRTRQAPPSVTIEVFTADRGAQDLVAAQQFVQTLDAALRPLLGERVRRGHRPSPVLMTAP